MPTSLRDLRLHRRETIESVLGPKLSNDAQIILPNDVDFETAAARWSDWEAPGVGAIVEASEVQDLVESVSSKSNKKITSVMLTNNRFATPIAPTRAFYYKTVAMLGRI